MRHLLCVVLIACGTPESTSSVVDQLAPSCAEATEHSDLAWIQSNIFDKSCGFSSCHGDARSGELGLTAGASHTNLIGVASTSQPSWKRVVPGNPDASYLMVALGYADGPLPPSGTMPADQDLLCAEKIDAVARWIEAGAKH